MEVRVAYMRPSLMMPFLESASCPTWRRVGVFQKSSHAPENAELARVMLSAVDPRRSADPRPPSNFWFKRVSQSPSSCA